MESGGVATVYTIGHSNHSSEKFIFLLQSHGIEVIADTRSQPASQYVPQFDQDILRRTLSTAGIKYVFLGNELGGRPEGSEYYDSDGHVLYANYSESTTFAEGILRLLKGVRKFKVALLCSEEDPAACHRRLMIGRFLFGEGYEVLHIRGDGKLQSEDDLLRSDGEVVEQQSMFTSERAPVAWRSTRSVSRKDPQNHSSKP
jgi:uncharacterized protein (DUF488 family)